MAFNRVSTFKHHLRRLISIKLLKLSIAFLLLCSIALKLCIPLIITETKYPFFDKDLCFSSAEDNETTVVILVLSSRNNFIHRNLIRRTYGSIKTANNVKILAVVFLLGNSDESGASDDKLIENEQERFGDIVMGDFVDSYRNLTLKIHMGYQWLTSHCREAQYVVKTDDDVVVNIFHLTKEIDSWSVAVDTSSNIWCFINYDEGVINNTESKFYASPIDFPDGKFPNHCSGLGYVTVLGVIDRIVDEILMSFTGNLCTHEDVFITGLVTKRINAVRSSSRRMIQPIKLVDKYEWIDFTFEKGEADDDCFFRNFSFQTSNEKKAENLKEFRRKHGTKIFYLLPHTENFIDRYLRLWEIIKEAFSESTYTS